MDNHHRQEMTVRSQSTPRPRRVSWSSWLIVAALALAFPATLILPGPFNGLTAFVVVLAGLAIAARIIEGGRR